MPPLTAKLHYPTLTPPDGTVYHLSSRDGVQAQVAPNGQCLNFSHHLYSGYTWQLLLPAAEISEIIAGQMF